MLGFLKTIGRHTIGAVVGAIAGGGAAAGAAALPELPGAEDPVALIATGVSLAVYALVEKALKPLFAKLGEAQ